MYCRIEYRAAIWTHSPEQRAIAENVMQEIQNDRLDGKPIRGVDLSDAGKWTRAEDNHQNYYLDSC